MSEKLLRRKIYYFIFQINLVQKYYINGNLSLMEINIQ